MTKFQPGIYILIDQDGEDCGLVRRTIGGVCFNENGDRVSVKGYKLVPYFKG